MTRTHRQRHRRLWLSFALVLPTAFVVGLLVRRPVPVMPDDGGLLQPSPPQLLPR